MYTVGCCCFGNGTSGNEAGCVLCFVAGLLVHCAFEGVVLYVIRVFLCVHCAGLI
jgi:hypothetical protein